MNKKFLLLLLFMLTLSITYFYIHNNYKQQKDTLKVGLCEFKVEYAKTHQEKIRGLSGREKIDKKTGMLFFYNNPEIYEFWMKDMNFSLDFIWILNNKVVDIHENIPPPNLNSIPKVSPKKAVNKILEINAGEIEECSIKIGDEVK